MVRTTSSKKRIKLVNLLIYFGITLLIFGIILSCLIFFPIFKEETKYAFRNSAQLIKPVDTNFGIVIPKILANAKVIDKVDPFNSLEYQIALTNGVAHAQGTAYPGHAGNNFIFAHSSANWFEANRYNSVFYLANKLVKGDEIDLYYKNDKYVYTIFEKKIVEASEISYLNPQNTQDLLNTSVLTLMTCYPPGTSFKRLIIRAKIQ